MTICRNGWNLITLPRGSEDEHESISSEACATYSATYATSNDSTTSDDYYSGWFSGGADDLEAACLVFVGWAQEPKIVETYMRKMNFFINGASNEDNVTLAYFWLLDSYESYSIEKI